ncbi:MAG: mechanosensitive ion channel domain-containing protein [Ignavibacteria bacterium]
MDDFVNRWLFDPVVGKIITIFIALVVIVVATKLIRRQTSKFINDKESKYRFRKLINFVGFLIFFIFLAITFSDKLAGLTVALGVAGAGIAFALQEVIASAAGWMAIMFGGFYKTGDRVQLGGIRGDVIDIGVLRTTLMEIGQWIDGDLYNGRIVRIANSFVFKEPVFNYSADFPFVWDEIKLPIRYDSDYALTREILTNISNEILSEFSVDAEKRWKLMLQKYLVEDSVTEPVVTITANDNWVEFSLRYTVDFKKRRTIKDKLFSKILVEIQKTNGKIRFASATFELVGIPPVEVKSKM